MQEDSADDIEAAVAVFDKRERLGKLLRGPTFRIVRSRAFEFPHLTGTCTSSMHVCHFRHDRERKLVVPTGRTPTPANAAPRLPPDAETQRSASRFG